MKRVVVAVVVLAIAALVAWLLVARRSHEKVANPNGSNALATSHAKTGGAARVERTRRGGRKVSGRVLSKGAPIAATVWLTSPFGGTYGGVITTRETGADGTFALADLPADRYTLAAFAPKLGGRTIQLDLRASDKDNVVLRLQPCDRELVGSVVDSSGGAIAGARIDGGGAATTTGPDGRYRLCTANTDLDVIARADGYASERRSLSSGDTDAVFELRPEAVVGGIVLLDGSPVANAAVDASPDSGRTWDRGVLGAVAVTGDDGTFEVHGIGAGDYMFTAHADGARTARDLEVKVELTSTPPVQLLLARTMDLRGRAHVGAEPAVGVHIMWELDDGPAAHASTDATGAFTLRDALPGPGAFTVPQHAIKGDRRRVVGTDPIDLDLDPGAALDAVIRGHVTSAGKPIADARVISREMGTSGDFGPRSGEDGAFQMDVHPGILHLAAESDELGLASEDVEVQVAAGQTRADVVLDLTRSATVAGTIVDEGGAPVEGATLTLSGANDKVQVISQNRERGQAVSRAGGAFRVTMLAQDTYSIHVAIGARKVELVNGSPSTIEIHTPGQSIEGVKVAIMAKFATIAGRVVDERGAPIADAAIEIPGAAKRRADVDGTFSLHVLARGRYRVIARGRPGMERFVDGVAPGTTDLVITLPAPGSIRVSCSAGVKRVVIYPPSGSVMNAPCGVVIDRMPIGHVFVRSADSDEHAESQIVGQGEIATGKETTITLAEVGTRQVELRITGGGKPVEAAGCFIDQAAGSVVSSNMLFFSGKDGVIKARALEVPSRLQCFSQSGAWGSHEERLDAETTVVSIELPRPDP